ncbi:putative CRIB domain-containing protein RIC7 [Cocos nucifera]|uniref:Putative CRIB domain-containing protein RIC7 n=1 Tax=Cocos nucifera TaxID=13894 RepID=A0A8K0IDN2_COCNU|nr:putative CRIB domain-containing protein RIC7 [Cocos nucifera]
MPRSSRRLAEPTVDNSPNDAPRPRHSRRHRSEATVSDDSLSRELSSDGSRRGSRRPRKKDGQSTAEAEAAGGDLPAIPKQSRRRSKGSSSVGSGDSIRASRSKNPASASDDAPIEKSVAEGEDERL